MKQSLKKLLSIVLAAVMVLSVMPVFAVAQEQTGGRESTGAMIPTIIIPGISQSISTYCDENGEPILDKNGNKISNGLLLIDSSDIVKDILSTIALPLLFSLIGQYNDSRLSEEVYELVSSLFSIQRSDKNGEPVNNLVVNTYNYPLSQYGEYEHGWFYRMLPMEPVVESLTATYGANAEDYIYLYTFPLIGDPIESARGLFDYIDMVKEQTGSDKVNLVAISLGGTIMSSYCDLVTEQGGDFSDINDIINVVACLDGTDLFADFYDRNWNLEDDFLYGTFIPAVMEANGMPEYLGHLVNLVLRIMPKEVLYTILSSAMDAILDTLIVNCPQFWSMVPKDRYEALADEYLSGEDYAVLRAKTDRYQQARLDLCENLSYAHESCGVDVYTVAGYGRQYDTGDYNFLGISGSSRTSNSDSIIDIDSASLGATYAVAGQTLENADSPEGELDISTCLFPETTWFFYGQHHEVGRSDVVIKLLAGILSGSVTDVNSNAAFPQFNFARNTKDLTKPSGLLTQAQKVIANDDGVYSAEQIASVQAVYDEAQAMLSQTVLTLESEQQAKDMTTKLRNALADVGVGTRVSGESLITRILNFIFEKLDSLVMKTVGGQGYSDKAR